MNKKSYDMILITKDELLEICSQKTKLKIKRC